MQNTAEGLRRSYNGCGSYLDVCASSRFFDNIALLNVCVVDALLLKQHGKIISGNFQKRIGLLSELGKIAILGIMHNKIYSE